MLYQLSYTHQDRDAGPEGPYGATAQNYTGARPEVRTQRGQEAETLLTPVPGPADQASNGSSRWREAISREVSVSGPGCGTSTASR